jgi:hypothetical protein
MNTNAAYEILEQEFQRAPDSLWETNAKKEPKKKAPPAPKVKSRGDGPRDMSERPKSARPGNEKAPRGSKRQPKSPTNVTESSIPNSAAQPVVKPSAPAAPQRSAPPPAPHPQTNSVSVPVVTGNQWARGPPRTKQPEPEVLAAPEPVVEQEQPAQQPASQQQHTAPAAASVKAWGNAHQSKARVSIKGPRVEAPVQESEPAMPVSEPEPAPAHQAAPVAVEQVQTQSQAATHPPMQEQYNATQHAEATATAGMAGLNLDQPAPATSESTYNAAYGYHGGMQGMQDTSALSKPRNDYSSNLLQHNATGTMPQMPNMYGTGFDVNSAASTTQMNFNAKMMPQQNAASSFGMDQESPTAGSQNAQNLLYQQQQYMAMMGMSGYAGFPGAYGNMAGLYGNMASMYGGYGGMPNSMGYGGMPNNMGSGNSGYNQQSQLKQHNHKKQHHHNGGGYGKQAAHQQYMQQQQFNSNDSLSSMYNLGNMGSMYNVGNMGGMQNMSNNDVSGYASSVGYGQGQQQQNMQQQQSNMQQQSFNFFGGNNMGMGGYNMNAAKNTEVNWAS